MQRRKGFTLVEILGVIVVLGIILAISVPKIIVTIEEAGRKAFTSDVEQFIGISKLEYNEKLEEKKEDIWYYFEEGKQTNKEEEGEIHFKGETPSEGYIMVTGRGEVELELVSSDGKWCASKELTEEKATIERCEVKEKEEIDLQVRTTNSTQSITVIVTPTDLSTYYYQLEEGKVKKSYENKKVYKNLEKNKEYRIKVKGCRKNETECKSKEVVVKIPDIDTPTYEIESEPENQEETKGWASKRKVTINYEQTEETDYSELKNEYIYGETEEEIEGKIKEGTWERCEETSCTLPEFTRDTYVIARITDGYNIVSSSVIKITNFDIESPTAPEITGGSESWINTSRTISISKLSSASSGIKKYQYYVSTTNTELTGGD